MNKETGKPLVVNGSEVLSEVTFIPESPNGSIGLEFVFNPSLLAGQELVVFEALYEKDDENPITTHEEINDEGQTVKVIEPGKGEKYDKTGNMFVDKATLLMVGLGSGSISAITYGIYNRRKVRPDVADI